MLGISVYLRDLDEKYIIEAAKYGAKYLFTSLHIPEENYDDISEKLEKILDICHRENLLLIPDISPVTFEKLGIVNQDMKALSDLGIKAIRLDYGFDSADTLLELQKKFVLFLNASVIDQAFLVEMKQSGLDLNKVKVAHNFYPKTETGLSSLFFDSLNEKFKNEKIDILAFIAGDALKRFPLYEGLPTLEQHRGVNSYVAAVELSERYGISDIMIGDSSAALQSLEYIQKFLSSKTITLPVYLSADYRELYSNGAIRVRKDLSDKVIRLSTERTQGIQVNRTLDRYHGAITIENELAGRYCGEVQICKNSLPFSSTTNIIGFVHPEYLSLLKYLNGSTNLELVPIEEA